MESVVSDLTYVQVQRKWAYICLLIDLFNREIIGCSTGTERNAGFVYQAFASVKGNLSRIRLFHTDRGTEFKNQLIDDTLQAFNIERSLRQEGHPL